jgi:hypothetical protein
MAANGEAAMTTDRRRYGVIELRRINANTYHLTIGGELWSEVEWSATHQRWCIQDAAGHCLTHVEHIVGEDRDVQTAIRLAKRMIVDGRMPTPEEAHAQLQAERERDEYLGEPFTMDTPQSVPSVKSVKSVKIPLAKKVEP